MNSPLSPYYKADDLIFISGQVGLGENDVIPHAFNEQAVNTLNNLKNVIENAGSQLDKTAKVTVFMTDLSYFDEFNTLYSDFFGEHKPARTTVGVKELPRFDGDPLIFIEIEAIATL